MQGNLSDLNPQHFIILKNVHQNNLKNLDLAIPHNKLIVITGVSGSGKSSLAFETLYEEGRRRYIESLSSYVRLFLGKMKKPLVDYIKGLPPAIAIEQKSSSNNPRSTVGTITEIYHYLKLLYARNGITYSYITGKEVKRHTVDSIVHFVTTLEKDSQVWILTPILKPDDRNWKYEFEIILQKGFTRIHFNNQQAKVEELLQAIQTGTFQDTPFSTIEKQLNKSSFLLVDRIIFDKDSNNLSRIAESVQTAFNEGNGICVMDVIQPSGHSHRVSFSNKFEEDGVLFEEPTPELFSFNSPHGACPDCNGFGELLGIDEDKVVPDKNLSIYDGAILCWEGPKMSIWKENLIKKAPKYKLSVFKPYNQLAKEELNLLWEGNNDIEGISDFFRFIESNSYKMHYRIFHSRFKGRTFCRRCQGTRLRKEANYVKIKDRSIGELVNLSISDLYAFFIEYEKENPDNKTAKRLLYEINNRLRMMNEIGLGYLTLNRGARTLSGGESQRIQLVYSIGSNLTGSLYILDEPSIGLHPRDTRELINILMKLRNLGNTVVVVEHDEDIIRAADHIIDLGPKAGNEGGEVIFQGNFKELLESTTSLTSQYLRKEKKVQNEENKNSLKGFIEIIGAKKHNLKSINVKFPVNAISVITGVSGSGKTTLAREVIFETFKNEREFEKLEPVFCKSVTGAIKCIKNAEFVGQESIDTSRRSNPVTYLKAFDSIRELFSNQQLSKIRGYTPAYFSFNVEGGRCEECKGDGFITVEMQFVADMHLQCESCKGKRFKEEILQILYNEKTIDDVLNMTASEASEFFTSHKSIVLSLKPLLDVGLDYIKLGQPTSTLSGGEAQRLKLASFLAKGNHNNDSTLFIFDEPSTGLHFYDIHHLLRSMRALTSLGHTVMIVEHNPDIIMNADYVIDLGLEGGNLGGEVVFEGKVDELLKSNKSYTGKFLKERKI